MDVLAGKTLVKADGSSVNVDEALNGKSVVLFYFSAHWCPPCRAFTPILKDFYGEAEDQGVEIIFVSSDRSAADMTSYMKESHGDWLAVTHGSAEAGALKEKYGISGIPSLIVVRKSDNEVITKDGRAEVQSKGPQAVKGWKWIKVWHDLQ